MTQNNFITSNFYLLSAEAQIKDAKRTNILQGYGLRVIRFTNDEVFHSFESVWEKIHKLLESPPYQGGFRGIDSSSQNITIPPSPPLKRGEYKIDPPYGGLREKRKENRAKCKRARGGKIYVVLGAT